jgi:flagellar protein FliO/FliZ
VTFRRGAIVAAIGVALAATVLTPRARAQQDPPRDTVSAPTVAASERRRDDEVATPLALRPTKPLELAQEPARAGGAWKIVAVFVILGGAAFYLRKRIQPRRIEEGQLTIVRRTTVGLRSELLIVNVEGQRLLIGVTPHSIQSLAVLDGIEADAPEFVAASERRRNEDAASERRRGDDEALAQERPVGERFAAVLKSAETPRPEANRPKLPAASEEPYVAGQARGLLGLRRQG